MTNTTGNAMFFFRLCYTFRSPKLAAQCHTTSTMVPTSVFSVTRKKKKEDKGKVKSKEEILQTSNKVPPVQQVSYKRLPLHVLAITGHHQKAQPTI
jgi:hypothetical protein